MTIANLPAPAASTRIGVACAAGAYAIWGVVPLYFHLLTGVDPLVVVACRVLFSLPLCLILAATMGQLGAVRATLAHPRRAAALFASACLIALNWTIYILAVQEGHVLATSLGYYINPLVSVLLGTLFLRERLSKRRWAAVTLAAAAVSLLAWGANEMLWISLILAFSFAFYGLIRKLVAVPAVAGLTIETMVLAPLAAGFLLFAARDHSAAPIAADGVTKALLVASALVTTVPLLLFAEGARRLELSTLGFIQYLAPSLSFLCGILILGESLGPIQLGAFALIWLAIAIYVTDLLSHRRAGMTKSAPA